MGTIAKKLSDYKQMLKNIQLFLYECIEKSEPLTDRDKSDLLFEMARCNYEIKKLEDMPLGMLNDDDKSHYKELPSKMNIR